MTTATLLPKNATAQELALEQATLATPSAVAAIDTVATLKEAPPEQFLLWLIWEYGLTDLLPYIADRRELIEQGLHWEKIKGTPEALNMALGWLNYGAPSIEEEDAATVHWHEFQVDPGGVPARYDDMQSTARLANLSAPVGTKLTRLFHGYDVRRFVFDRSAWGDLLSDYSGVYDETLDLVLSFGRDTDTVIDAGYADGKVGASLVRAHATNNRYEDRPFWDFSRFGDKPILNLDFVHSHLHQVKSAGLDINQLEAEKRVFPKAAVVLSDAWVLGDTNSTVYAFRTEEFNAPAAISDGLDLSGAPWEIKRFPIDERIERETESSTVSAFYHYANTAGDYFYNSNATAGHNSNQYGTMLDITRTTFGNTAGQTWVAVPWAAETWANFNFDVRGQHYGNSA